MHYVSAQGVDKHVINEHILLLLLKHWFIELNIERERIVQIGPGFKNLYSKFSLMRSPRLSHSSWVCMFRPAGLAWKQRKTGAVGVRGKNDDKRRQSLSTGTKYCNYVSLQYIGLQFDAGENHYLLTEHPLLSMSLSALSGRWVCVWRGGGWGPCFGVCRVTALSQHRDPGGNIW